MIEIKHCKQNYAQLFNSLLKPQFADKYLFAENDKLLRNSMIR